MSNDSSSKFNNTEDLKDFVCWARALGATRVAVGDVFVEFEGASVPVEEPAPAQVKLTPEELEAELKRNAEELLYGSSI